MNDPEFRCWSCNKGFNTDEGFSVDGSGIEQVCAECWEEVPIAKRLNMARSWRFANEVLEVIREEMKPFNFGDRRN